jgi:hypothetical protein
VSAFSHCSGAPLQKSLHSRESCNWPITHGVDPNQSGFGSPRRRPCIPPTSASWFSNDVRCTRCIKQGTRRLLASYSQCSPGPARSDGPAASGLPSPIWISYSSSSLDDAANGSDTPVVVLWNLRCRRRRFPSSSWAGRRLPRVCRLVRWKGSARRFPSLRKTAANGVTTESPRDHVAVLPSPRTADYLTSTIET